MSKSSIIWIVLIVGCHRVPKNEKKEMRCTYGIDHGIHLTRDKLDSLVGKKMILTQTRIVPLGLAKITQSESGKYFHYYEDTSFFLLLGSDSSFYFKDQKGTWYYDSAGITFLNDPFTCRADALNGKFRLDKLADQNYLLEHRYHYGDSTFNCKFLFSLKSK